MHINRGVLSNTNAESWRIVRQHGVLQCVTVCCSVLQCVAVFCIVL